MGPRLRIVSDARESATHLDRGRQLALLIKDSADRGSSLEQSWSSTLSKIERLQPQNLAEAMAKFEVAQAYAAWSSPGEGRASALIAAASSALHEFLAPSVGGTRQPLREQIRGHRAQGHTTKLSRSVHT